MRGPFKRLFRRGAVAPPFIETRLERLASYPPMPPPPPAEVGSPAVPDPQTQARVDSPGAEPVTGPTHPQIKLILADGTESTLLSDPELAARADYLVKSMLPPRPPGPDEGSK
ncbi:MAG TPA: hypothetical protein VG408_08960 [Actinomycetota bacterium]|nr:hypothetical protein [Actinomycetota bacterium]